MKHLSDNPGFRWSFSKLASFEHCPMSFYLEYVCNPDRDEEIPNYYAEYGSCAHKILEEFLKGDLPQFCLAEEWSTRYPDEVKCPPPPYPAGYADKAFAQGLAFFETFDGFGDEWEVLSVEKKFVLDINGHEVSGIADCVLRHKETGKLWVIDHKGKSKSSLKRDMPVYRNQLYLYALWCLNEFHQYPSKLSFHLFKDQEMVTEDFSEEAMKATIKWIDDTIQKIETCDLFEDWTTCIADGETKENFFCKWVCGCNSSCERYQEVRQISYANYLEKKAMEAEMYG